MRIRINYKKEIPLRFTSALDLQQIWERSLRRAGFRVTYSQGFHPQPKIQLGLPLPLGFISNDEIVDIWVELEEIPKNILERIQEKVPVGITILNINSIDPAEKPFILSINETDFKVTFWDNNVPSDYLSENIAKLLNSSSLIRTKRNGKEYDLRPLILDLKVHNENGNNFILVKLITRQKKMGRPDEVMKSMGFDLSDFLIQKIHSK